MFIGHIPAGYIITKTLQKKFHTTQYLWLGLLSSIIPDLDILYFYLIDNRQTLHHDYWIHIPFYWMIIAIITFITLWKIEKKNSIITATIVFSNIFLHLFLDTIVGKIKWMYPINNQAIFLFHVPSHYNFWVYNFIFHWTFLLEIAVIIWASTLLLKTKKIAVKNKK